MNRVVLRVQHVRRRLYRQMAPDTGAMANCVVRGWELSVSREAGTGLVPRSVGARLLQPPLTPLGLAVVSNRSY